jgi:hypothetical protein
MFLTCSVFCSEAAHKGVKGKARRWVQGTSRVDSPGVGRLHTWEHGSASTSVEIANADSPNMERCSEYVYIDVSMIYVSSLTLARSSPKEYGPIRACHQRWRISAKLCNNIQEKRISCL